MKERAQVPEEIVARLRAICLALPAAYEESAWVGTRWKIGRHNFAHVVAIDAGWPPAYAKAAGSMGPLVVVTFRVPASKLETARFTQRPYFKPVWARHRRHRDRCRHRLARDRDASDRQLSHARAEALA